MCGSSGLVDTPFEVTADSSAATVTQAQIELKDGTLDAAVVGGAAAVSSLVVESDRGTVLLGSYYLISDTSYHGLSYYCISYLISLCLWLSGADVHRPDGGHVHEDGVGGVQGQHAAEGRRDQDH